MVNEHEKELLCDFKGKEIVIHLKKRNTRDEYRLFLNKHRELIGYDKNDLMVFRFKSGKLSLEVIKKSFNISQDPRYNDYNSRLGNKFHLLL
jgi:plasmid replication initiation protein